MPKFRLTTGFWTDFKSFYASRTSLWVNKSSRRYSLLVLSDGVCRENSSVLCYTVAWWVLRVATVTLEASR